MVKEGSDIVEVRQRVSWLYALLLASMVCIGGAILAFMLTSGSDFRKDITTGLDKLRTEMTASQQITNDRIQSTNEKISAMQVSMGKVEKVLEAGFVSKSELELIIGPLKDSIKRLEQDLRDRGK